MSDVETELKFRLGPEDMARLRTHPLLADGAAGAQPERLVSTYFDTPDGALRAAGVSLRVREVGDRRIQTVKSVSGAGLFSRGEWEQEIGGAAFDLDAALSTPLGDLLDTETAEALRPIFVSRVNRSSRMVHQDGAEVEVSLDDGEIEAGERREAVSELELELKAGRAGALFDLARSLGEAAPLQLSFVTKAEAGYRLLDPEPQRAFKAEPADIHPGQTAAEAFQAVARTCLAQLTRNAPAVLDSRSPEALHQMRVAVRRLRTALTIFRHVVADDRRAAIAAELKWAVGELNDARNLDVFIRETYHPSTARAQDRDGMAALGRALLSAQQRAYERAHEAIASARYRQLILDVAAWSEAGPWIADPSGVNTGERSRPVTAFAADALAQRFRAVRKKSKVLTGEDPAARHKLRIALKKLRYASEFFAPLYAHGKSGRRHARFVALVAKLQDRLGVLNDLATAQETVLGALAAKGKGAQSTEAAYDAGLVVAARAADEDRLIKDAAKAFGRLEDAKPFW